jgi:hypothetical protein
MGGIHIDATSGCDVDPTIWNTATAKNQSMDIATFHNRHLDVPL